MSQRTGPRRLHYLNVSYGLKSWLLTKDHKRIAILYLLGISVFFLIGGLFAVLIRLELATPAGDMVQPDTYNRLFTMHGVMMIFFFLIPSIPAVLGNFLIPLMIGADDMAFPRLNMLSYWTFFVSTVVLIAAFFAPEGGPGGGWTSYPPLAHTQYSGGQLGVTLWILAVALEFAAFLMGGINFITTAINLRAPGMSLFDMPLMVWMQVSASVIFLFSVGQIGRAHV